MIPSNIPVAVVYQELDSVNDLTNYVANKMPKNKETKLSPSKTFGNGLSDPPVGSKLYSISPANGYNNEYMIRMDTSLTKDIQRGAPGKHGKIPIIPVNRISQIDDENSLELSPIQRTELSCEDRSLDDSHDRRPTRTSAVAMLYKPSEIKRRFNKYSKVDFNATLATQSDQVRLKKEQQEAKNVYRPRNQK
jgi:hypothetical protein